MKKYLIVHKNEVEFTDDLQQCKSPLHQNWCTTDIFNDGFPITMDDFDQWPWFVFDYNLGVLYDMAPTEAIAIETIEDVYIGDYVTYEQFKQQQLDDSYTRAMGIL